MELPPSSFGSKANPMVKKLFALASVTALTGLMAATAASGCSSSSPGATETDAATAGDTSKAMPPKDSGATDDGAMPAGTCPTTDPITAADIEMQLKWVPPAAPQSVCTQKNIDDLRALFVKGMGSAKFTDIETTLGATCSPCVFTPTTAANWGPLVKDPMGYLQNEVGSCLAQVENAACGKAFFEFDTCLVAACPASDCGDQTAIDACQTKAAKGACKALNATVGTACPKISTELAMGGICADTLNSIAVSCGGGVVDGGLKLDASQ
jgi:hypothetical protein